MQVVEAKDPLAFAAAAEDTEAVLDIARGGVKLAGGDGTYVRTVLFIPEKVVVELGADRFYLDNHPSQVRALGCLEIFTIDEDGGCIGRSGKITPGKEDPPEGAVQGADLRIVHIYIVGEDIQPFKNIARDRIQQ